MSLSVIWPILINDVFYFSLPLFRFTAFLSVLPVVSRAIAALSKPAHFVLQISKITWKVMVAEQLLKLFADRGLVFNLIISD